MELKSKPLSQAHALSTRWGRTATFLTRSAGHRDHLYGDQHSIKFPMMALRTSMELGPVRHALSQIVVSGEMVVFPPFVKPPPKPPAKVESP